MARSLRPLQNLKGIILLLLCLAASTVRATEAFILIPPASAGSPPSAFGTWVLWPPLEKPGADNRLLSLFTGMDWSGSKDILVFQTQAGRSLSTAFGRLAAKGYFLARDRVIQGPAIVVALKDHSASPSARLLALSGSSPEVQVAGLTDSWPASGTVFAEAGSWDQVSAIAHKAAGRVLVVEYPPPAGSRWSRYWLRGDGWSDRLPLWGDWSVPGLMPASQLGSLLEKPLTFHWVDNDTSNWGGADRWLSFVGYASPLTLAIIGFLVAFFAGCTIYLISREERAPFAASALKYFALVPAAVLLSGQVTWVLGPSLYAIWLLGVFSLLIVLAIALGHLMSRVQPKAHPMLAISVLGFAATSISPPLWTMYSHVLGVNNLPLSPEGTGAFFAYLVGICAFTRRAGVSHWIALGVAVLCLAWGVLGAWWSAGLWPFQLLPLIAILIGSNGFRLWQLPILAALPLANGQVVRYGLVWAPGNLYPTLQSVRSLNVARHAEFLLSHGFLVTALIAGVLAVFVERFFFHEIRRTLVRDSRVKALFHASFACAAMGIFQPLLLYGGLICFIGGTFVLLTDTAKSM